MRITLSVVDEDGDTIVDSREYEGHGQYFKLDQALDIRGPLWLHRRVRVIVQTHPDEEER